MNDPALRSPARLVAAAIGFAALLWLPGPAEAG